MNKAVLTTNDYIVPSSPLDNVFKYKSYNELCISFYDFFNGNIITSQNKQEFYQFVTNNAQNKIYSTTDHLITCVKVDDIYFLYVSLDNSVRANMNNNPLYMRLDAICQVVNKIIISLNQQCIVFFSESCRPSFLGDMNKKENFTSWLSIRQAISNKCNLN